LVNEESGGEIEAAIARTAVECGLETLELLAHFARRRREFSLDFTPQLARLMLAEEGVRVRSLRLASVLVKVSCRVH